MGLARIVDLLRCPHCRQPLSLEDRTLQCPHGHSFDVARQGYVNLLTGSVLRANADSAAMVQARDRFLGAGHYDRLTDRIAALAAHALSGAQPADPGGRISVLEPGAGTGHYLSRLLDRLPTARGIAADLSPAACRRAARAHDRLGAVVADTWAGLPVLDGGLDLIMVVFAPQNAAEFARMVRPGGLLLVAAAAPDHLAGIRAPLGLLDVRAGKRDRLTDTMAEWFDPVAAETVTDDLQLEPADLHDLVAMGPNAHHQAADLQRRIEGLPAPVRVSCAVELTLFRRR
jgi:23S rRNA (guanine745-N1)-methyltransferase